WLRTAPVGGRHHSRVELLAHLPPDLAIRIDVREIKTIERKIGDPLDIVVAVDAIPADRRADDLLPGRAAAGEPDRNRAPPPTPELFHAPSSTVPTRPAAIAGRSAALPQREASSETGSSVRMVARSKGLLQAPAPEIRGLFRPHCGVRGGLLLPPRQRVQQALVAQIVEHGIELVPGLHLVQHARGRAGLGNGAIDA